MRSKKNSWQIKNAALYELANYGKELGGKTLVKGQEPPKRMGKATVHKSDTRDVCVIPNGILTDGSVRIKARGIMLIIYSLASDGDTVFTVEDVKKYCYEPDREIARALRDLEVAGYLDRIPEDRDKGPKDDVAYEIHDKSIYKIQKEEYQDAEKVSTGSN